MTTGATKFGILGPLRVWQEGSDLDIGYPKQRAVLAALLLRDGAQATLQELVDDVWGHDPPKTALSVLRTYVYRLRQVLEGGDGCCIRSKAGGYDLITPPENVDLNQFKRLVSSAAVARGDGQLLLAETHLRDALSLWKGVPLAGVPGPYAETQRTRLNELQIAANEEFLACNLDLGRHTFVATELPVLVARHPLRERLRELHMIALYGSGRQAEALAVFDTTRRLLRTELGVDPGVGLLEVHRRVLAADPGLARPVTGKDQLAVVRLHPSAVRPAQLPADLTDFVDRGVELSEAVGVGHVKEPAPPVLISGMAGIGKSALAVHWAHQLAPRFPDGQLYTNLRGFGSAALPLAPGKVLGRFLRALGAPAQDIPADLDSRAAFYRSLLADRQVLVVLDNARDTRQVLPLLPGSSNCLTIITGRVQMPDFIAAYGAYPVHLPLFDTCQSREFLVRRLGATKVAAEPQAVAEIIEGSGQLPLTLAAISARAVLRPHLSLSAIAAELHGIHRGLDPFAAAEDAGILAAFSTSCDGRAEQHRVFNLTGKVGVEVAEHRLMTCRCSCDDSVCALASQGAAAPYAG
ncbi:BTAD domain-containing putative transcriptional regulator [Streptomyces sp. NPDC059680]|uniref:AfsR/SARP family transcriptional regulator n=1 Tax=Streptomyces sp. NPDC059680 TaxID=3346904 RepID=UPI0036C80109